MEEDQRRSGADILLDHGPATEGLTPGALYAPTGVRNTRTPPFADGSAVIGRSSRKQRTTFASWSGCEKLIACAAPSMTAAVTSGSSIARCVTTRSLTSGSRDPITTKVGTTNSRSRRKVG